MALKLVYSQSPLADLKKSGQIFYGTSDEVGGYQDPHNEYYYSVVFTADGQIITHGNVYNAVLGDDIETILTGVNNTDDPIKLSVNGGKLSAVLSTKFQSESIYGQYLSDTPSVDTYAIKVPQFTVDIYGRIKSASLHTNAIHADYVKSVASGNSKTYYLLGHETVGNVNSTLTNSKLKATTDGDGNLTLTTLKLVVTDAETGIKLGTGTTTLKSYVEGLVNTAKTLAMSFKGVISNQTGLDAIPNAEANAGDTYKIDTAGTYSFKDPGKNTASNHTLKIGDVLIAKGDGTFYLIPAGDETVTRIKVASSGQSTLNDFTAGDITLGTAALKTVGEIADSNTGLVTGDAVFDYITNDTSHIKSFNLGNGLLSNNTSTSTVVNGNTVSLNLYNSGGPSNTPFTNMVTAYPVALSQEKHLLVDLDGTKNVFTNSNTGYENKAITTSNAVFLNLISKYNGILSSLKIASDTGVSLTTTIDNTADCTLTIKNTGITAASVSQTVLSSVANAYEIGTISITAAGGTATSTKLYGHDTNTWRPVLAYDISNSRGVDLDSMSGSTGTKALAFGSEFGYAEGDTTINDKNTSEIHLIWAEINLDGVMTYHV